MYNFFTILTGTDDPAMFISGIIWFLVGFIFGNAYLADKQNKPFKSYLVEKYKKYTALDIFVQFLSFLIGMRCSEAIFETDNLIFVAVLLGISIESIAITIIKIPSFIFSRYDITNQNEDTDGNNSN